ncbi:HNH endonuclease [Streptomyces sp. NBC_01230]|uniref:HNH endonuclease signature motif containing protein n=1 Tax=Streptomyces sp. NBC_01230 TaxID=2903784 RepID=UPI002E11F2F2|nr:HNH endonuclease [Streptomyces sp. NBC_01230]
MDACSIAGCTRPVSRRGWCGTHYQRWRRNGDPTVSRAKVAQQCSVDDCGGDVVGHGWCSKHYQRWQRNGTVEVQPVRSPQQCSVSDCTKTAVARGWCSTHWMRWQRNGAPDVLQDRGRQQCDVSDCTRDVKYRGLCGMHVQRFTRTGSTALYPKSFEQRFREKFEVGPADQCWVWTGATNDQGYGHLHIGGKGGSKLGAHRVSYELSVGPIPDGLEIDHLCRNTSCVNPQHLEPVTTQENNRRAREARTAETSGARQ